MHWLLQCVLHRLKLAELQLLQLVRLPLLQLAPLHFMQLAVVCNLVEKCRVGLIDGSYSTIVVVQVL